jgi:hypothetical protein
MRMSVLASAYLRPYPIVHTERSLHACSYSELNTQMLLFKTERMLLFKCMLLCNTERTNVPALLTSGHQPNLMHTHAPDCSRPLHNTHTPTCTILHTRHVHTTHVHTYTQHNTHIHTCMHSTHLHANAHSTIDIQHPRAAASVRG